MVQRQTPDVPKKAHRILRLILVALVLIVIRVWYLAEIQYEQKVEEAKKPQKRVVMEPAKRGTIRDRFNVPLAINKIQYQAGVIYSELTQVPRVTWEKDSNGKKVKRFKRSEYITRLSELLAEELNLSSERIDDLIHAKAAFYHQVPFILSEELTEEQYYRLNLLAKDWPGLHVQRAPKRYYPKGKVGGDIIGYMGAINRSEYDGIMNEIKELRLLIEQEEEGAIVTLPEELQSMQEVRRRLKDLEEHAYSANDSIGKAGVEAQFEEMLRGYHGKKTFYSDARGNFLRELPGTKPPLSGQRLLLSISAELQEYAEQLLAKNEKVRKIRISTGGSNIRDPWIRGGAIVAMDPKNGDVITLATFPRYNPNDFVDNHEEIAHWFETEEYVASIWDQKRQLEREVFEENNFKNETLTLNWNTYLDQILPVDNPIRETLNRLGQIRHALLLQKQVDQLLKLSGQPSLYRLLNILYDDGVHVRHGAALPAHVKADVAERFAKNQIQVEQIKESLDRWFGDLRYNYDKVLLVDLCRLAVSSERFDDILMGYVGHQSIGAYRDLSSAMITLRGVVQGMVKELFHDLYFKPWRAQYGKEFLKEKRRIEKEQKRWAKPYVDYFDQEEKALFASFWEQYQWRFLTIFIKGRESVSRLTPYDEHLLAWHEELDQGAHQALPWRDAYRRVAAAVKELPLEQTYAYIHSFRSFDELTRPLYGRYRYLKREKKVQMEKHLAMAFYPLYGWGHARSFAYRQGVPQGSIFKLVPSFSALMQRYEQLGSSNATPSNINPLTIVDQPFRKKGKQYVGQFMGGKPIPQLYKGGRLMRTMIRDVGEVDLIKALEFSSNPYFSLLAGDYLEDPKQLGYTAELLSFGKPTGIDLPYEVGGRIPNDLDFNKTGLYSMANGQHTLLVTPLQTCVMLSTLANGGTLFKPNIVSMTAGSLPKRSDDFLVWKPGVKHRTSLFALGLDFPLFAKMVSQNPMQLIQKMTPQLRSEINLPPVVQKVLFEGMRRVVDRQTTRGLGSLTQLYRSEPSAIQDLVDLKKQMVGKTSTAESMESLNLDLYRGTNRYNHVWFGGISFDKEIDSQGFLVKDQKGEPELVVVVYLRYGSFGKEAAPLAAQVIKKWREIQAKSRIPA